jgi:Rnl2 family RNA ligase
MYCFDIAVLEGSVWTFLPFADMLEIFQACDILCATPIASGRFEDVMALSPVFETTVPARLGLPAIPGNVAEGLVVRPSRDVRTADGRRLIIKKKHPLFSEFSGAAAAKDPSTALERMCTNPQRLDSVLSKCTAQEKADATHMATLVVNDAEKDHRRLYESYTASSEERARLVGKVGDLLHKRSSLNQCP